jgi:AcrR family transcriptional regulator
MLLTNRPSSRLAAATKKRERILNDQADHPAEPQSAQALHEGRGHDTRARLQQVALKLFAEKGYEKTSLREIAERLGVTKAALYYHFQSKEEIVRSLLEDYFNQMDTLLEWGRSQPAGPATRRAILARYVALVAGGSEVFRMLQQNQAAISILESSKARHDVMRQRLSGMIETLAGPDAAPGEKVRAAMAVAGASMGWMWCADLGMPPADLNEIVLAAASSLVGADEQAETLAS